MPKFRKKPIEVEATQWTGTNSGEIKQWVGLKDNGESYFLLPEEVFGYWNTPGIYDKLHDTWVHVFPGQWIIKGIQGEFYPCANDVFKSSYEPCPGD